MEDCIFCKILRGEIPADKVLENEDFIAIRDINPKAPVHVLVIPREHVPSLAAISHWDDDLSGRMLRVATEVAELTGIRETGYRVVSNAGPDAGQEVDHLHVHVLGGKPLGRFW
ncbi:MAG: histidine triad nucleotide-binding protein [Thermoleophilia bacterium]